MKSLAASISFISLLWFFSLLVRNQSEASNDPHIPITLLAPAQKSEPRIASPTPTCTPQSSPENEKLDSDREMTAENALNASLGTTDWDCDGIRNIKDNCIFVYNPDQKDGNGDGKGDVCDPSLVDTKFRDSRCDQDVDGVPDFKDNCIVVCNPDQKDRNKNSIGDVCDKAFPRPIFTLKPCAKPLPVTPTKSPVVSNRNN